MGQPVRYEYVSSPWDLDYYQTVYAVEPGSAEMPSAGRAFTWKLLFDWNARTRSISSRFIDGFSAPAAHKGCLQSGSKTTISLA